MIGTTVHDVPVRNAELLQIHLLDNLYSLAGSEHITFQGGTAIRWLYGGLRFSEDLDFVTHHPPDIIEDILRRLVPRIRNACIAHFGPGVLEQHSKGKRSEAVKTFFIFRPQDRRERIAVKTEFEMLAAGHRPQQEHHVLRDLPSIAGIIASGRLALPYSSSIIVAETPSQILADKVRALFERNYLKGRDLYDIWWLHCKAGVSPPWEQVCETFSLYRTPFTPARSWNFFQKKSSEHELVKALKADLSRFIPPAVYGHYEAQGFSEFIESVRRLTATLLEQGMKEYLRDHGSGKGNP